MCQSDAPSLSPSSSVEELWHPVQATWLSSVQFSFLNREDTLVTPWGGSATPPPPSVDTFFFLTAQASPFVSLGNLRLDDLSGRLCSLEKPEVPMCFHHRPRLSWSELQPYPPAHPTLYLQGCLLTLAQPGCPSETRTICPELFA